MAAPCRYLLRSVLLKDCIGPTWCLIPVYRTLTTTRPTLTPTRTEQPQNNQQHETIDMLKDPKKLAEDDYGGPEYIPSRKAKNPMMKIGYAWMIGLPAGIIGFILAKREVDKNRQQQLRIRQRMKKANEGEYDGSRYRSN
ncbi:hypothetical protein DPEC_G00061370 [Dallia pectoralis]|uniref:Uncharacterized protein n=1 Tax=Dallia pectoralis TaxID=75939 RepID=A0ACC2H876_DALPE|nr:hypothetical protein DPEC_G00061370 [Dallia pectoralis]